MFTKRNVESNVMITSRNKFRPFYVTKVHVNSMGYNSLLTIEVFGWSLTWWYAVTSIWLYICSLPHSETMFNYRFVCRISFWAWFCMCIKPSTETCFLTVLLFVVALVILKTGRWCMVFEFSRAVTRLHPCWSWFWCLGWKCTWNTLESWAYIVIRKR